MTASYPSDQHRRAAEAIAGYFGGVADVEAVLLIASCARGKATPDSCLDIAVLVRPEVLATESATLEAAWGAFEQSQPVFAELRRVGRYSIPEVYFFDGCYRPGDHGYTSGPDEFELEIGNTLAYSLALLERGDYLARLRERWLPYYDERLRARRLAMVQRYGQNNLDHVGWFVERGLYFQAFNRLYDAERELLQALFISRRTYPIAYDKWIREQIVEILGLPELYRELVSLFEVHHFESDELIDKATRLGRLYEEYVAG
ncbi:MAG: hypothetical protein ACYC5O_17370 [Anaerolineae bacterium]